MSASLGALVRAEATKALRQPSTWVLATILAAYGAIVVFALASILGAPASSNVRADTILAPLRRDAVGFLAGMLGSIGSILLVVFAAQSASSEFARGTLRTLLLHRARRRDVAWSKAILLLVASALVALGVVLLALLGAGVFGAVAHESFLHVDAGALALLAARTWASLAGWSLLALGATLATRSLGFGLGATLGTLVVGDLLAGLLLGFGDWGVWASRALPNTALGVLGSGARIDSSSWAWIVPNLLVYVGGPNLLAAWQLERLDVIAATK